MRVESFSPAMNVQQIGPQYDKDKPFAARMRFHQSWYRAEILKVGWGKGPGPGHSRELGSMLTPHDGEQGLNFLSPEIFAVARSRMAKARGGVERYRLLHNLLSSQPMCFNLFGPLVEDLGLATALFKTILPGEIGRVIRVEIEYAPEPAGDYLDDKTAFDAFVEYRTPIGDPGFLGIETKLTEPFSQKEYDRPAYRRWSERADSPWPKEAWSRLPEKQHNQLWRDHLLAVPLRLHPESPYARGHLLLVHHPQDDECADATAGYLKLLKPSDASFHDQPLDQLIGNWRAAVAGTHHESWLDEFARRYVDLSQSEDAWRSRD